MVPCVDRSPAALVLTVWVQYVLVFQLSVSYQCGGMDVTQIIEYFPTYGHEVAKLLRGIPGNVYSVAVMVFSPMGSWATACRHSDRPFHNLLAQSSTTPYWFSWSSHILLECRLSLHLPCDKEPMIRVVFVIVLLFDDPWYRIVSIRHHRNFVRVFLLLIDKSVHKDRFFMKKNREAINCDATHR